MFVAIIGFSTINTDRIKDLESGLIGQTKS
jgi:hypothetical protein